MSDADPVVPDPSESWTGLAVLISMPLLLGIFAAVYASCR